MALARLFFALVGISLGACLGIGFAIDSAQAQTQTQTQVEPQNASASTQDNWFFYMSTGMGRPAYDASIQTRIDQEKERGGSSPFAGSFDLPGVYRHLSGGWAAGAVLNMMFENVARQWSEGQSFSIQIFNPSLSALYFTGGQVGLGWFTRADVGVSRILQLQEGHDTGVQGFSRMNDTGVIGQFGIGYGWQASQMARVLAHLNAFYSSAVERHASGLMFHVGFLL